MLANKWMGVAQGVLDQRRIQRAEAFQSSQRMNHEEGRRPFAQRHAEDRDSGLVLPFDQNALGSLAMPRIRMTEVGTQRFGGRLKRLLLRPRTGFAHAVDTPDTTAAVEIGALPNF